MLRTYIKLLGSGGFDAAHYHPLGPSPILGSCFKYLFTLISINNNLWQL